MRFINRQTLTTALTALAPVWKNLPKWAQVIVVIVFGAACSLLALEQLDPELVNGWISLLTEPKS